MGLQGVAGPMGPRGEKGDPGQAAQPVPWRIQFFRDDRDMIFEAVATPTA
jgi:hypothetical protein